MYPNGKRVCGAEHFTRAIRASRARMWHFSAADYYQTAFAEAAGVDHECVGTTWYADATFVGGAIAQGYDFATCTVSAIVA